LLFSYDRTLSDFNGGSSAIHPKPGAHESVESAPAKLDKDAPPAKGLAMDERDSDFEELGSYDAGAKRAPDYERLQTLIREDILSGRIPAGSRLKVSEIAATYGTSTNPAREALRGLEGEGLVVILPNRGASVRVIDETLVANLFDIRGMIEPHVVRHFVETASQSDIDDLEELQLGCEAGAAAGNHAIFHQNNIRFHDLILDCYPNAEAIKIMRQHSVWLRALNRKHPLTVPQMRRSNAEHVAFIDAVHRGDHDQAIAVMQRHRQNSKRVFLGQMREEAVFAEGAEGRSAAPLRSSHQAAPARQGAPAKNST
jgi:DNA-binding GntR family transcriptional regulator